MKTLLAFLIAPLIFLNNAIFRRRKNNIVELNFYFAPGVKCYIEKIDGESEYSNDFILVASYISLLARYFYICDDRQIDQMRIELTRLFQSNLDLQTESFYEYNGKIFEMIFMTLDQNEKDAVVKLFHAFPPLRLSNKPFEGKKLAKYSFVTFLNDAKWSSSFYMSVGPDKILLPLCTTLLLEFVLNNLKSEKNADLLSSLAYKFLRSYEFNQRRSMDNLVRSPRRLLEGVSPNI